MEAAHSLQSFALADEVYPRVFEAVPPPTLRAVEALAVPVDDHDLRAARERRRARHAQALTDLFADREDLRGVSLVADHFVDFVRFTA